jgi:hypothetical protein
LICINGELTSSIGDRPFFRKLLINYLKVEERPMLLHLLYVVAFTILAILAVSNLIRNLITIGLDTQRGRLPASAAHSSQRYSNPHPELLDGSGNVVDEPLLVMRSMSVEDAREQLDAIFKASPGVNETRDDS